MPAKTAEAAAKTVYKKPHHKLLERLWDLSQPGLVWTGLTVLGLLLRVGPVIDGYRWMSALLIIVLGSVITGFDAHMRQHRATLVGRYIGPGTAGLGTLMTVLFLLTGFSVPLVMLYVLGGLALWVVWALWLVAGDPRDLGRVFEENAEAAGVPGARLHRLRRERTPRAARRERSGPAEAPAARAVRAPQVTRATMSLPPDPVMTADEAAGRIGHIEAATHSKPGSWAVTSSLRDGSLAEVVITDPEVLTRAPIEWPGPSAPGADMSVPFRLGMWQDGTGFLYPMLPLHHRRVMGRTGTAKTMGCAWNLLAEGVTRESYAAFVIDAGKGSQFFGSIAPALHRFETSEEGALDLFAGLHRVRKARCEYLAKDHYTAWVPECRLSYMHIMLEEAAVALRFLNPSRTRRDPGVLYVADWEEDVTNGRTAGMAWDAYFQKTVKDQAASTVARSSMGAVCLGVDSKDDAKFGLTDEQFARGAQPWLWKSKFPGMAMWDTDTVPDDRITIPMRFFCWAGGTRQIGAYMSNWTADVRPLDDITMEALENRAPRPASSAYPSPVYEAGALASVTALKPPARRGQRASQNIDVDAARDEVRALIRQWAADGRRTFKVRDILNAVTGTGRTRQWLYGVLPLLEADGLCRVCTPPGVIPKRWEILCKPQQAEDSV
jgi:hypothetical protein